MQVIFERPPNYAKIVAAFPHVADSKTVLFCYGNFICNPGRAELSSRDHAHEEVHSQRQAEYRGGEYFLPGSAKLYGAPMEIVAIPPAHGPEGWWDQYLIDTAFRFDEELRAHVAEYAHAASEAQHRRERRFYLNQIAGRLAGPLYGRLVTTEGAKRLLKDRAAFSYPQPNRS